MQAATAIQRTTTWALILIVCALGAFVVPGSIHAQSNTGPCAGEATTDTSIESGGGTYVPVRDFEQISLQNQQLNTLQSINGLLTSMCQKEYVADPQIQQEWASIIGQLVQNTQTWVRTAYNGNPVFLQNPYIYYDLVEQKVYQTYIADILASNIGASTQLEIVQNLNLKRGEAAGIFPYDGNETLAPDGIAQALSNDYEASGGSEQAYQLFTDPGMNFAGVIARIQEQLDQRVQQAIEYEEQKLDWGRGFFSYEICDLQVYQNPRGTELSDRRNCRIATPGSLIQEQTALVLGSGIRQMEEADEVDEWVSASAVTALNDILNNNGLNTTWSRLESNQAVSPSAASGLITPGVDSDDMNIRGRTFNDANLSDMPYPSEFYPNQPTDTDPSGGF